MNLVPSGIDLFLDSETCLSELTEEETAKTIGGIKNVNFFGNIGQAVLAEGDVKFEKVDIQFSGDVNLNGDVGIAVVTEGDVEIN